MADITISGLPGAGDPDKADIIPVVQGASTRKMTIGQLATILSGQDKWRSLDLGSFTSTAPSDRRIDTSDTAGVHVMMPIRWYQGGKYLYGVVSAFGENSYVEILGPAVSTSNPISRIEYGSPSLLVTVDVFLPGAYATSTDAQAIANQTNSYFHWMLGPARLVLVRAVQAAAEGIPPSEPKVNVSIAGDKVLSTNSGNGILLKTAGELAESEGAEIIEEKYAIAKNNRIELAVSTTSGIASDLTVSLAFVLE